MTAPEPGDQVRRLMAAWHALAENDGGLELLGEPVAQQEFEVFEREHDLQVPAELRSLFTLSGGGLEVRTLSIAFFGFPPPTVEEVGLDDPFPAIDQFRVVGSNLGNDGWAVWLPRAGAMPSAPLIVIREYNFDDVIIAADDAVEFLTLETAAGLLLATPGAEQALDALAVPEHLRRRDVPESDRLDDLTRWVSAGRQIRYHARRDGTTLAALIAALEAPP